MPQPKTLSEIASAGVRFEADEAVAVIQQLITAGELDSAVVPPLGPPSLDNVFIDSDGSVACHACATSPAVLELGILLQAMLPPDGRARIPGALRHVDDGARNYHVQPSPAGDRIAYDSDRDGERGVYTANRDGSGVRRVSGRGYAGVPTWSPDGRQLAFIRAETNHPRVWNLWLLTLDTGDARRLTHFRYGQTWSASWFADGMRICYAHEDRLFIHNLATGGTRAFESPVKGRLVRTPAVSPDGKYVMFQVARNGAWLLDVRRGTMDRVLTDATAEEFAWSRDGRRVAFHSRRDGEWGIWLITPPSK